MLNVYVKCYVLVHLCVCSVFMIEDVSCCCWYLFAYMYMYIVPDVFLSVEITKHTAHSTHASGKTHVSLDLCHKYM